MQSLIGIYCMNKVRNFLMPKQKVDTYITEKCHMFDCLSQLQATHKTSGKTTVPCTGLQIYLNIKKFQFGEKYVISNVIVTFIDTFNQI